MLQIISNFIDPDSKVKGKLRIWPYRTSVKVFQLSDIPKNSSAKYIKYVWRLIIT